MCIRDRDNVTGLIWEQKTNDGSLHDKNWTYTWYNPDNSTNGGSAGVENGGSCGGLLTKCNTQTYISALNNANYCGYSDWHMPDQSELLSIVDHGRSMPSINPIFSNTQSAAYWSGSRFFLPPPGFGALAWGVYFDIGGSSYVGYSDFSGSKYDYYVRAVRNSQ